MWRAVSMCVDWDAYSSPAGVKPPSEEQKCIIEAVAGGSCNVQVNAVAGSGKTTTILHVANACPGEKVLALLYSARLKEETRRKADKLPSLTVHSFHAFAVMYYDRSASKDEGLVRIVDNETKPLRPFSFDVIIIDEIQDMTKILADFVFKILRDNKSSKNVRFMVMGDDRQNIFLFKGADSRFLTLGPQVFEKVNLLPWSKLTLNTTFRLTGNVAAFMNKHVLHYPLFNSPKPAGPRVQYNIGWPYTIAERLAEELGAMLQSGKVRPDDIFIIAPTIKLGSASKATPINLLANLLLKMGYPFYVPISEDKEIDGDVAKNKILVSTFHQTKGLERKIVVVFSFCNSYFEFYNKNGNPLTVPNILYVACTRASERLILVAESTEGNALPFLKDPLDSSPCVEYREISKLKKAGEQKKKKRRSFSVTNLCKFLPEHVSARVMSLLQTRQVIAPYLSTKLEKHVNVGPGLMEEVFELNGLAIPAMYERATTKANSTIQTAAIEELLMSQQSRESEVAEAYLNETLKNYSPTDISGHLRLAAIYSFATSGFLNKAVLIKDYNWLSLFQADECIKVLQRHLRGKVLYEESLDYVRQFPFPPRPDTKENEEEDVFADRITITGRVDAITLADGVLWELKCVNSLDAEHIMQLAVYAWMAQRKNNVDIKAFRLLNMRTGEMLELEAKFDDLEAAVSLLVQHHLKGDANMTDVEFLQSVLTSQGIPITTTAAALLVPVATDGTRIETGKLPPNKARVSRKKKDTTPPPLKARVSTKNKIATPPLKARVSSTPISHLDVKRKAIEARAGEG